jgi:cysteinyl-tRNA synthetase
MYTCGVTVYDECHIGHARSLYVFNVIRQYLIWRGLTVQFVRNITDIDDKIINRANELNVGWQDLVAVYIARYREDLEVLGLPAADAEPRATDNIPEMVEYIGALIAKGYAYQAHGDVYFSVRAFPAYGKLSGQSIDAMRQGTRIEPSERKKDPLDFALWKASKPGEPAWDSPWGRGRPGWHIECSVMSAKFLKGGTLDIHAGGRDLVFPHHENEIAQSEALSGHPFARYWIHHGLLTINGQKMSKSLGNFITIRDFLARYRNPDILKLFFLAAHYAHPVDYTDEKIAETTSALERLMTFARGVVLVGAGNPGAADNPARRFKESFIEAMDDDFNTPRALAALFDLVSETNKRMEDERFVRASAAVFFECASVLGLSLKGSVPAQGISDHEIEEKLAQRAQARRDKDFSLADCIRKELEACGVIIEDTKGTTLWRRKL